MSDYKYTNLAEIPSIKDKAAEWFHSKWGVPKEAYLECMCCLHGRKVSLPRNCREVTEYGS